MPPIGSRRIGCSCIRTAVLRLDAVLGTGRYLVHRGTSPLQMILGGDGTISLLSGDAGPVQRAVVSSDGKALYGFSSNRIVRFEVATGRTPPLSTSPTVVIDSANAADVWLPRSVTLAAGPPASEVARPAARYAFWLGGNVWTMGADGTPSLLRPGPSARLIGRAQAAPPAWSPRGDRVLFLDVAGPAIPGANSGTLVAYTVSVDGTLRAIPGSRAASSSFTWSPDGASFAVVVDRKGVDGLTPQAELEARFFGLDGAQTRAPMPAREIAWTRGGIALLSDDGIDLVSGDDRRAVTTRSALLNDPRAAAPLPSPGNAPVSGSTPPTGTLAGLSASPDGTYLGVRLVVTSPQGGSNRALLVTIRVSDGALEFLPSPTGPGLGDLAWSPAVTLICTTASSLPPQTAEIRGVAAKSIVARQEGRFAGWAPDGASFYVARPSGLFAYRLAGGEGVRISAIGVPVSATKIG